MRTAEEKLTTIGERATDERILLSWFEKNVGTSLDAMFATGILRNSITRYIADLETRGKLRAIATKPDSHTGMLAKYYTADRSKWHIEPMPLFPQYEEGKAWEKE